MTDSGLFKVLLLLFPGDDPCLDCFSSFDNTTGVTDFLFWEEEGGDNQEGLKTSQQMSLLGNERLGDSNK